MRLDTHRLQTLDQDREFLAGSEGIDLQPQRRADAGALVATILQRFDYALRGKTDKSLLRQHWTTGAITGRRAPLAGQVSATLLAPRTVVRRCWRTPAGCASPRKRRDGWRATPGGSS